MEDTQEKPKCQLVGIDGNVFSIIGAVSRALKKAGQPEKAKEFQERAMSGDYDYNQILGKLIYEYVEPF